MHRFTTGLATSTWRGGIRSTPRFPSDRVIRRRIRSRRGASVVTEMKIANPGPLGLSGFALTTFILSLVNAGILSSSHVGIVIGLAVAYGGIAQFAAGMWEFRTGDTCDATALASFGAFRVSFAVILIWIYITKENGPENTRQGLYVRR